MPSRSSGSEPKVKGRKPDPTRAKRGTGNRPKPGEAKPSKAVSSVFAVPVPVEAFPPPDTLPAAVHEVWRACVSDLGGANHMRPSFLPQLVAYCQAVYVHEEASLNILRTGTLVSINGKPTPNPLLKVQKDAAATMLRFSETLGFTPAARIRLGLMEVTGMSLLAGLNAGLDR